MAELFGTAAGVLQVAEVGFNLATTLYKYASTVKGAERDIKRIARDIKLTSKVLERTHQQLKADQQGQLCSDDALFDLEDVLDGCREAFQEVDEALQKSMKPSGGKLSISLTEKLKWPLKQDKLEVLRANLEKLKTTLLLMLSVLAYGSKMQQSQSTKTEVKVELSLEKLRIQNLIDAKDEATSRYEELSAAFSKLETRINESSNKIHQPSVSSIEMNTIAMMATQPSSQIDRHGNHEANAVSVRLGLCASAVSKLTTTIDTATKRWESEQILEHDAISLAFQAAAQSVVSLREHSNVADTNVGGAPQLPSRSELATSILKKGFGQHSGPGGPQVQPPKLPPPPGSGLEWTIPKLTFANPNLPPEPGNLFSNGGSASVGNESQMPADESGGRSLYTDAMPMNPSRLPRKRTKAGCLTCRKARIKCGEERPVCKNCINKKRRCEGYNQRVVFKDPLGYFSHGGGYKGPYQATSENELISESGASGIPSSAGVEIPEGYANQEDEDDGEIDENLLDVTVEGAPLNRPGPPLPPTTPNNAGSFNKRRQVPPVQQVSDINTEPFGVLDDDQLNLDFSNLESTDTLQNFDFDSFLNSTAADDSLGFGADFAFKEDIEHERMANSSTCQDEHPALTKLAARGRGGASRGKRMKRTAKREVHVTEDSTTPQQESLIGSNASGNETPFRALNRTRRSAAASNPEINKPAEKAGVDYSLDEARGQQSPGVQNAGDDGQEEEDDGGELVDAVDGLLRRWTKLPLAT